MPAGKDVRPQKWTQVIDLYDDGEYSAIWGYYDGGARRSLGVRWNGDSDNPPGYPKNFGYPVWYVEPRMLERPILLELLSRVVRDRSLGNLDNILTALSELPK